MSEEVKTGSEKVAQKIVIEKRICKECGHVEDMRINKSGHPILSCIGAVCFIIFVLDIFFCGTVIASAIAFIVAIVCGGICAASASNPTCPVCQKEKAMIPYDSPEGKNILAKFDSAPAKTDAASRIAEIQKLKDAEAITDAEFEEKRKQILAEI